MYLGSNHASHLWLRNTETCIAGMSYAASMASHVQAILEGSSDPDPSQHGLTSDDERARCNMAQVWAFGGNQASWAAICTYLYFACSRWSTHSYPRGNTQCISYPNSGCPTVAGRDRVRAAAKRGAAAVWRRGV